MPTQSEILEETIRAAEEDRFPFDGRMDGAAGDPNEDSSPVGEGVMTAADLTVDLVPLGRKFPIGRKHLYIHAMSGQDQQSRFRWCVGLKVDLDGSEDVQARQALFQANLVHIQAYQVILCCRVGPRAGSKRCFARADVQSVLKSLGYRTIQEICRISDELGGNDETLGPGTLAFFGPLQTLLSECAGALSTCTKSHPGLKERAERMSLLVSQCVKRGVLVGGISSEADL